MLLLVLLACMPDPPAPDVFLVVVDALRADRVTDATPSRPRPTIQGLQARGLTFTRAFSHGPDTRSAMPALLSGLDAQGPWLGERFQALGYQTAVFTGNAWIQAPLTEGFQTRRATQYSSLRAERVDGEDLVADFERWLAQAGPEPALAWLHLMDVHAPLDPPPGYAGRYATEGPVPASNGALREPLAPEVQRRLADRYDESVAWVDALLKRVLEAVDRRARPAVVVLTADHGEALGERDQLGHGGALTPELLRVPLVIALPNGPTGVVDAPVGHLDVLPTLLVAAGASEDLPGVDLAGSPGTGRRLPARGRALDSGRALQGEIAWPWLLSLDSSLNLETGEIAPPQPLKADFSGFRDVRFREDASGRLRALGYVQ